MCLSDIRRAVVERNRGVFVGFQVGFRGEAVGLRRLLQVGLVNGSQGRQRLPDGVRGKSVATKATGVRCWVGG